MCQYAAEVSAVHWQYPAENRQEGKKAGKQDVLLELVRDGLISAAEAAKRLSVSEDDIIKMLKP